MANIIILIAIDLYTFNLSEEISKIYHAGQIQNVQEIQQMSYPRLPLSSI